MQWWRAVIQTLLHHQKLLLVSVLSIYSFVTSPKTSSRTGKNTCLKMWAVCEWHLKNSVKKNLKLLNWQKKIKLILNWHSRLQPIEMTLPLFSNSECTTRRQRTLNFNYTLSGGIKSLLWRHFNREKLTGNFTIISNPWWLNLVTTPPPHP